MEKASENPIKKYGVGIDMITPELMNSVIKIYEETVGKTSGTKRFSDELAFGIDEIISELKNKGSFELRLGSNLNSDSKLQIKRSGRLCYFQFHPNYDYLRESGNKTITNKADDMIDKFRTRINEFMINSGIGSDIQNQ